MEAILNCNASLNQTCVAIQNGIHAGPIANPFCNFTISECQRHEVPMWIATIGIGLGLGLGLGLDFGLGLGIVTGAPFRDTCHTLALALALLAWPCLLGLACLALLAWPWPWPCDSCPF